MQKEGMPILKTWTQRRKFYETKNVAELEVPFLLHAVSIYKGMV